MIYQLPDTVVSYLDIKDGSHGNITIQDLLSKEFHIFNELDTGIFSLHQNHDIMIRSLNGWTKLLAIEKYPVDLKKKYWKLTHRKSIVLSEDHIIPGYCKKDINNPINGFHGSINYTYSPIELSRYLKSISKIDMMRFYRSPSENGFFRPHIESFDNIDESVSCYNLTTESKFFNLNDFYLF